MKKTATIYQTTLDRLISKKLTKVETKVDSSEKHIDKLQGRVDLIYQYINTKSPIKAQSPTSLTEVGNEIVKNISANEILEKYKEKLCKEVEKNNPQNAYDIQKQSQNAYDIQKQSFYIVRNKMKELLSEEELLKVKNEAYNRGLLIDDIISVFGILLRDLILKEKQIPISDVDKHTPPIP
jgi:hypothetical protein